MSPSEYLRDVLQTALIVVVVGVLLFGVSGVWPPMVAVESGSMSPHMHKGDLILVTQPGRWTASAAETDGVVTTAEAGSARTLGGRGDVIVYTSPTLGGPPIIHRARFHVATGENWYRRANESYLPPDVDNCEELAYCPAPHGGYITKGDANSEYDQVSGISPPVRQGWVQSTAAVRIPWLGWIRLVASGRV